MKGALIYIIQNCQTAFEELKKVNIQLASALNSEVETGSVNHVGALHRMIQDYLIVRMAGLFDNDNRVVSFENFCPNDSDYVSIKNEAIVKYLINLRHNFAAHANLARMQNGAYPETTKILESNIEIILQKLIELTNKY